MLFMYRNFFFLFCLFFSVHSIQAQSVSGIVREQQTQQVIEYSNIALYQLPDSNLVSGTVTNPQGEFMLKDLQPGFYYLMVQFIGYKTQTVPNIQLQKGKPLNIGTIFLKGNAQLLQEIEIQGEKATTLHKIDRQVFEAASFQSAVGGTATDLLRNMPSVTVNALGEISVRGTSGFVLLLNGKPLQSDALSALNQLPANAVANIEIITAPSAKYDPEGKAGIINIITQKGATDGVYLQVNGRVGLPSIEAYDNAENPPRYGGDFTLNYRKDKWNISLGASYQRYDISGRRVGDVYTIIQDTLTRFPSAGERSFDEINYSGRFTLDFTPNAHNAFSLGFYAGKRNKERTADILYFDNHALVNVDEQLAGTRVYTFSYFNENLRIRRGDFVLGSLDYAHTFQNKASISTSLLYEYTMLGGPTTNLNLGWPNTAIVFQDEFNTNDNPLNGLRYQLDFRGKPREWGTFEAGYQYRFLDHTGDFVYERRNNTTGVFELVPEFSSTVNLRREIHSVYGQFSGQQGKFRYGLGLRLEATDRELDLKDKANTLDTTFLYDFIKPFPSANIQYAVHDNLTLKAAYSKRIERTTTFKMNPFPEREHSETLEQGDPTLLPEFIDLVELGVIQDFGDNSSVYASAYYRNTKNLINRVNTVFNDTILNRIYSNVGTAEAWGLEVGTTLKPFDWWKIFAGGNVYNYQINGSFDNRAVNTSNWIYSINTNSTFTVSPNFTIQWTLNYISARNTAQGEDSRFLSPNLTLRKTFLKDRLSATLQWFNMDLGLLPSNEQRITTFRDNSFFTTTNYIYEVDVVMINLSYLINATKNKAKFIKSEFGAKEF